MGHYHKVASVDKKEVICPFGLGTTLKLVEQIWSFPGTPVALFLLTVACNGRGNGDVDAKFNYDPLENPDGVIGRWAGDRIITVGDYLEEEDPHVTGIPMEELLKVWRQGGDGYKDISESIRSTLEGLKLGGKYIWQSYGDDPATMDGDLKNGRWCYQNNPDIPF